MGSGVQINKHVEHAFSVEALVCLQDLKFSSEMGFQNVVVEGDSITTIVQTQRGNLDR